MRTLNCSSETGLDDIPWKLFAQSTTEAASPGCEASRAWWAIVLGSYAAGASGTMDDFVLAPRAAEAGLGLAHLELVAEDVGVAWAADAASAE